MKVVVAHNRYASAQPSGENVVVDAEIEQLRNAGVTVVPFVRSSDEIAGFSPVQKALLPLSPIRNGPSQRALTELLGRERPDLLHLHNPYPLLSPWVVRTAHHHRVPVVQTVHNYRQVCLPGLYFRDGHICTECRGKRFAAPGVRHACYRGSRAQSAVLASALSVHRGTWHSVDRFIALTDAIAGHLRDYGIPDDRIAVKPNAVADPWAGSAPPGAGEGFLFAARLSPEKGLGLLLEAWRRHTEGAAGPLRIAGDGPLRGLAEAAAADRSDISYLGPLDQAGVRAEIRSAACVVAASTWHDVLPTIVLEALAGGRPVLATDLGGLPYLVDGAGWLVAPTVDGLAGGLARAGAPGAAAALSAAARRRYEEHFTPDVLTKRLIEIYGEVLGR
jgi:glycosyltransferase involved in cell wall biosynthesis